MQGAYAALVAGSCRRWNKQRGRACRRHLPQGRLDKIARRLASQLRRAYLKAHPRLE
jgi:hypothetical protein